jgi:hypothetical protein
LAFSHISAVVLGLALALAYLTEVVSIFAVIFGARFALAIVMRDFKDFRVLTDGKPRMFLFAETEHQLH